jgi:hypothetical protein
MRQLVKVNPSVTGIGFSAVRELGGSREQILSHVPCSSDHRTERRSSGLSLSLLTARGRVDKAADDG